MIYDYDLEFLEDGRTIELISIGIVAEDGREYYAVNQEAPWSRIRQHEWLMGNVVPHLPPAAQGWARRGKTTVPADFADHHQLKHRQQIAHEVSEFIRFGGESRNQHELWAYYGAYDHVALCQLWGRMIDLPPWVPMFTRDIKQLAVQLGPEPNLYKLASQVTEHHALADARWNQEVRQALQRMVRDAQRGDPELRV
jgi:hypothetical protein